MTDGSFGLNRESAIANSKVRQVFTPFSPIDVVDHFIGREKEVSQLVSVINSPGQHALLCGDRGVGKTSLATIACSLIERAKVSRGKYFSKRCDSEDTFASIVREPLRYLGIDYEISEETKSHAEGGDARLKIPVAEGGFASRRTTTIKRVPQQKVDSPSWVAERLTKLKGLFLIDEADALSRKIDRKKIAELIKLLSDARSGFKIMVVGIAETGEELTAGHPSVERCLKETHLSRMADADLRNIILKGMEKLRLRPSSEVVESIVRISAGYPHFAHLICLKCAENAIVSGTRQISSDDLAIGLRDAVSESEGVLKRRYENTIRGVKHEAEYVFIMQAAARCPLPEFKLSSLHKSLEERLGTAITSSTLSRYMTSMLADGKKGVFVRVSKGVYRFTDPRMPSFIKMVGRQSLDLV
jgi:Cdc6-like AAA superfamily ATPase